MKTNLYKLMAGFVVVALALAACGGAATTAAPAPTDTAAAVPTVAPTTAPAATDTAAPAATDTSAPAATAAATTAATTAAAGPKVGLVSDVGGIGDKSFNDAANKGLTDAVAQLGLDPASKFLQSRQQTDYAKNIQEFIQEGYPMIVTVGFLMGLDTATAAKANPTEKFAIVDYSFPDCFGTQVEGKDCGSKSNLDNVLGLTFHVEQASFLAGYLAASVSKTKKVGTYGGLNIPPVDDYMVGFEGGVKYWNQKHNDKVAVLGWSTSKNDGTFTQSFTDPDKGKQTTLSLIDEGADVVLPVAGQTGLGTFTAAKDKNIWAIGVDVDQCVTVPDACPVLLTSVKKNIDVAVFSAIKSFTDGSFKGGVYSGTLDNNGVGLADYHNNANLVTPAVQSEMDAIKADIIAGKIDIKTIAAGK